MMPFKAGAICCTGAGNLVFRLLKPSDDQPAWVKDGGDVQWDVFLLFDAACKQQTGSIIQLSASMLVEFDVIKMGMLWQQLHVLRVEFERWLHGMATQ